MPEQIVIFTDSDNNTSTAIITKAEDHSCPQGGDCNDDGPAILQFYNSDKRMTQDEYDLLPVEERAKLNVKSGECSCSKCGSLFTERVNIFYL